MAVACGGGGYQTAESVLGLGRHLSGWAPNEGMYRPHRHTNLHPPSPSSWAAKSPRVAERLEPCLLCCKREWDLCFNLLSAGFTSSSSSTQVISGHHSQESSGFTRKNKTMNRHNKQCRHCITAQDVTTTVNRVTVTVNDVTITVMTLPSLAPH